MMKQISVLDAQALMGRGQVKIFDLRDEGSYAASHIQGAVRLTQENLIHHVREMPMDMPIIIYCYHGISSQAAAEFLADQGFESVYSLLGGFEAWREQSQAPFDGE